MNNDKLLKLINFRNDLFFKLKNKRINYYDVVAASYQFLSQNKIRHITKCHDFEGLLLNYYFWQIHIERKISSEIQLIKLGYGSRELLMTNLEVPLQRRNQMVKRLIKEAGLKIKEMNLVGYDLVEILTEDGIFLYSSKQDMDNNKIPVTSIKKTLNPIYLPFIDFHSIKEPKKDGMKNMYDN